MRRAALIACALAAASPVGADEVRADDMAAAAGDFYAVYATLPHVGGIPDATARSRYAPLLSPRLASLINQAAAAEIRFAQKNRNAPPLIEGDLFSSMFEGATAFKLDACTGDLKLGQCSITLTHQDPGQKPVTWTDMLMLTNTPSGWKVDDIAYKAQFQFGNTGRLSDLLKMVAVEAG